MKKTTLKVTAFTILAAIIVATPVQSGAADTSAGTSATKSDLSGPTRFYGTITAVDTNAMTFTVDSQTLKVTGETHITKNGGMAALADAAVGESARGSYTTTSDGKLVVTRVRFGENADAKAGGGTKSSKSASTKFYGTITAVDTNAMTFTVDDQTFKVTGETRMTNATNSEPATLDNAVVGEPARGSFIKTTDGKLEVTKVRFGKKTGKGGKHGGKKETASESQQSDE